MKGAALVALSLLPSNSGFNLAPNRASQVASFSTGSSRFLTPHSSSDRVNHVSKLYSTLSDEKETKSKSTTAFDPADEFTGEAPSKILGGKIPYSELTIGVLKETYPGENRVSVAPESAKMLVDAGFSVVVESGGKCIHQINLTIYMLSHKLISAQLISILQLGNMLRSVMRPTLKLDVLSYPKNPSTPKPTFSPRFAHPMKLKYPSLPKRH